MEVTLEQLEKFRGDLDEKIKECSRNIMSHVDSGLSDIHSNLQELVRRNEDRFENVNKRFESYVKFSTFTWVFGIAMVIVIGLFSIIWNEIRATNENVSDVKVEATYLRGQWDLWTKE